MRTFLLASVAATVMTLGASVPTQAQTSRQQAAYGLNEDGQKIGLTDEERIVMRRYVHPGVPRGVTTGAAGGNVMVAPGDRIPDGVALHPFPAAVYHEAPELGAYRYITIGARDYAVDPRDRSVIEEIDR